MTNFKKNLDHYMNRKGIKMYSHLLVAIAHELGIKGQEAYEFATREKANFSKMLKGQRSLKYEFIIPLERIFGVSLARLLDEEAYKLPIEPNDVPYIKGFRYYAYKDDPTLYNEEFKEFLGFDGQSSITKQDEFGKTFLDYVVEYKSVNGVRFLHDTYHLKLKFYFNQFSIKPKGIVWTNSNNMIEFARLVASMSDAELFNDIYDTYHMFASNGFYLSDMVYSQPDFLELILDNEHLYKTIFEIKKYDYELENIENRKLQKGAFTFNSINPIINGCLNHALNNLKKYKSQAVDILEFGISYNEKIKNSLNPQKEMYHFYKTNELGGIYDNENNIVDVAIFVKKQDINDVDIKVLVEKLPKIGNLY